MCQKSETLQTMLSQKKGCRNNDYGGERIRDLREILHHEIGSMGNTDVLDYMKENYDCIKGYEITSVRQKLLDEAKNEEELRRLIAEEESLMAVENYMFYVDQIIEFVESELGKKDYIGLWLTTKEGVIEIYDGNDENISEYSIPDNHIVISDLGIDGSLFVF